MRGNLCRKKVTSLNNRSVRRACPTNLRNVQHRRGCPSENPIGRPLQSPFISPRAHARISTIVAVFCLHAFTIPRKPLIAKGLQVKAKPKFAFTNTRFGEGSEGKKHDILCSIYAREGSSLSGRCRQATEGKSRNFPQR